MGVLGTVNLYPYYFIPMCSFCRELKQDVGTPKVLQYAGP